MVAIYDLTARQLTNAQAIYRAALPHGRAAVMAALMAAGDESSYLRYANNGNTTRADVSQRWRDLAAVSMQFAHDAVAGEAWTTADSIGLFQQRLMFGYSSPDRDGVADLMDPAVSTVIFICGSSFGKTKAFRDSPKDLPLSWRVQWTQGSEHPDGGGYGEFETVAAQLIDRFSAGVDIPTSPTPSLLPDWIPMTEPTAAQQVVLDAQWEKIAAAVVAALTKGQSSERFLDRVFYSGQAENRGQDTANKGAEADVAALTHGQTSEDFLDRVHYSGQAENSRQDTSNKGGIAVAALAKVVAEQGLALAGLAEQLVAIAATLAAQDAASIAALEATDLEATE